LLISCSLSDLESLHSLINSKDFVESRKYNDQVYFDGQQTGSDSTCILL